MKDFTFYSPTKFVFGKDTEQRIGQLCREAGATKVLLVYGGQSAQKSGLLDRIQRSLTEAGISFTLLGGVKPNPRVELVRKGKVRRAKLYYLRDRVGKAAKVREKL